MCGSLVGDRGMDSNMGQRSESMLHGWCWKARRSRSGSVLKPSNVFRNARFIKSDLDLVSCQLSVVSGQLSVVSGSFNGQRTTDNGQRTTDNGQRTTDYIQ